MVRLQLSHEDGSPERRAFFISGGRRCKKATRLKPF
nr:MAG TPA: hypothetical protein [Caudoviricetes sp.]